MDKISLQICTKRCEKLATKLYNSYIEHIEKKISANPKFFWSFIKAKRQFSSRYPASMSNGACTAENGLDICNMFGSFFSSVYRPVSQSNDVVANSSYLSDLSASSDSLCILSISCKAIYNYIKKLDITKGPGSDGIPPLLIVKCADTLVAPLYYIFSHSLKSGIFPRRWKLAKVVPIHKNDSDSDVGNYRPISILPTLAKVFEALICPMVQNYFKKYISLHQHGFTSARSTSSNLVTFIENILDTVDSNKQIDVIYADFSKAFDKVSHNALIQKLEAYGFLGSFVEWLRSYLVDRSFYVVVDGYKSSTFSITSGVPQGSHLGPILFNIFINDLPVNFSKSIPFMFADDLKIARTVESIDDALLLQKDINRLTEWCKINKMELNIKKCLQITFTRKLKPVSFQYSMMGVDLKRADVVRDLGVLLDQKLTFLPHLDNVIKKASKTLGFVIRNAKTFKKPKTKILVYNSLVRSILEYCSVVWRPHYATHTLRLERVQKRFLNHLAFSMGIANRTKSYNNRLQYFKMESLEKRQTVSDLTFLFKVLHSNTDSPTLLKLFNFRIPNRYPRKPVALLHPPFRKTVLGSHSPVSRLSKLYNTHSNDLDIFGATLTKFKNQVHASIVL